METAEDVLGISMLDPDILKATQFVMVTVFTTLFFLVVQLTATFERSGFADFTKIEIAWWIVDVTIMSCLTCFGYFGVKRSNRSFLAAFFFLSFLAFVENVVEGAYIFSSDQTEVVGEVVLCCMQALYFVLGMHYSRYLWREAGRRSLNEAAPGTGSQTTAYSLMGIHMLDMKVLKATQRVFTSIAIVASVFGSWLIAIAQPMLTDESSRPAWLIIMGLFLFWIFSGYFGVRLSRAGLLRCFSSVALVFSSFFGFFFVVGLFYCPVYCKTQAVLFFGIALAFGVAWRSSIYLKDQACAGVVLTKPITSYPIEGDSVTVPGPVQVGVPAELELGEARKP